MKRIFPPLAALFFAVLAATGHAAAPEPQAARPALPNGVAPCESCHGARGEGNPAVGAPRIAAQSSAYLARQLAGFADGSRNSQVMTPIAKALDEKKRNELAAYYATLEAPRSLAAKPGEGAGRGRELAARGDNRRGIQACANCHGPEGIGEPPGFPYLAGQQGGYLVAALKAWRDGSRKTDPSGQMPTIAKRLADEDLSALAAYYSSVPAPGPEAFRTVRGPAKAPATAARQGGPATPPGGRSLGVGTEQGAPTTGGTQGPGGGGGASEERGR